jgi:hypothetical protein
LAGVKLLQRGATIAAVAAITAVGLSIATKARGEPGQLAGDDAELRRLWAKYLEQLDRLDDAELAHKPVRDALDAEWHPLVESRSLSLAEQKKAFDQLWKKHGIEPLWNRVTSESRKLVKITKAIRKAKAEGLFGIGVKLSVTEYFEEYDVVQPAEDARRALGKLTGYDFIAATGPLGEEADAD